MKKKIGNQNVLYPTPVTVVGALVNGKINFLNIAHVGILNAKAPHLISLGMGKMHHTNAGIRENKTFSVNILSQEQMVEADYVGLVSGTRTDKSGVFETFFGELKTAVTAVWSHPVRITSAAALPPRARPSASTTMDLPEPVSPERRFSPG